MIIFNHKIKSHLAKTTLCTLASIYLLSSCSTHPTSLSREIGTREPSSLSEDKHQVATPLNHNEVIKNNESSNPVNLSASQDSMIQKRYFDWPIDEARLTRGYSADPIPHPKKRRKKKSHWGIDLAAYKGTPIYASHHGEVKYSGKDFKGYGKMVLVEGENGWATIYAHLDKIIAKEGQKLRQGDLIGLMGKTGRVTGVHLHFEIRQNKDAYDPLMFLPNGEKVLEQLSARN